MQNLFQLIHDAATNPLCNLVDRLQPNVPSGWLDVAGAITDLTQLLLESAAVDGEDGSTTRAIRETLGKAYFYGTSLLKANGATEEEWRPYAERTRQVFRYLAEHQDPAALADYERRVQAEFNRSARLNNL